MGQVMPIGTIYSVPRKVSDGAQIVTATYTEYDAANSERALCLCNWVDQDYWVSFQDSTPSATANMIKITSGKPLNFDAAGMPKSKIWVYHSKGSDSDIQIVLG